MGKCKIGLAPRVGVVVMCLVMMLSAVGTLGVASSRHDDNGAGSTCDYVPGELLVKFKDTASKDKMKDALDSLKGKDAGDLKASGIGHWKLDKDADLDKAIKKLEKDCGDDLEFAEPNYYRYADVIPDDTYRGDLWGMHNVEQTGGTNDADIDAMEAWVGGYTGSSSIVVGCIDSGIDYNHEDLAANIWENPGEIGPDGSLKNNGHDDDGNGYIDDWHGWNFVSNTNNPMDDNSHGTHTAGTIGAVGNNGKGVVGVCWNVKLMPLKFLNSGGSGTSANMIKAINYAAWFKDGSGKTLVRVTSNSYGGGSKSKAEESAIKASGAIFVCSAGNSGSSSLQYPAGYTADNIISVAATDQNDALASWSNYGSTWVDLGAPGVGILSTVPSNGYASHDGTSMACPHVAGVAALLVAHTTKTNTDIKTQILNSVDTITSLNGKTVTGGRLNAASALGATALPADTTNPSGVTTLAASDATETSLTLGWTAPGDDGSSGTAWAYDIRYSTSDITDSTWDAATPVCLEPGPLVSGSTQSMTVSGLDDGTTYYFALKAFDEAGNSVISNVPSEDTVASLWKDFEAAGTGSVGRHAFAYDNNGDPAFVYKVPLTTDLMYAKLDTSDGTWTIKKVATGVGDGGVDIAFDAGNNPGIVYYSDDAVKFANWNGASWSFKQLEARKGYNDYCSIGYSGPGKFFGLTYYLLGPNMGLWYATFDGSSWTKTLVESKAGARYNAIDFDSTGKPGIAYSDDHYGNDNILDAVVYAKYDGSKWNIEEVDGGTEAFGVFTEMAYDPDDVPHFVHSNSDLGIRYITWDPDITDWAVTTIGGEAMGGYTGVTVTSSNVPYVSYHRPSGNVYVAHEDASGWTIETVALGTSTGRGMCIDYFNDAGTEHVGVSYVDGGALTFMERTLGS